MKYFIPSIGTMLLIAVISLLLFQIFHCFVALFVCSMGQKKIRRERTELLACCDHADMSIERVPLTCDRYGMVWYHTIVHFTG